MENNKSDKAINNDKATNNEEIKSKETDEIVELKKALQQCQKERDEFKEGWQRERANFENFQKNLENIFKENFLAVQKKVLTDIIEVADHFYIALSNIPPNKKDDLFIKGIMQIKDQLEIFLKKQGLEKIGDVGEVFDPAKHEAITTQKTSNKDQDDKIAAIINFGYKIGDTVIRPAKVITMKYENENKK